MQELYRNADNTRRFTDADIETIISYTYDDLTGFAVGDVLVDYMGVEQTILAIEALPAGLTRVLMAAL